MKGGKQASVVNSEKSNSTTDESKLDAIIAIDPKDSGFLRRVVTSGTRSNSSKSQWGKANFEEAEAFDVIKGPIHEQMIIHYIWYGLLLIFAHLVQWTYIWFWTFPAYIFACYVVLEITRLFAYKNPNTNIQVYLSFIPYMVFHILARRAHMQFGIFWFFSIMGINLQIGFRSMKISLIVLLFLACYLFLVVMTDAAFSSGRYNQAFEIVSNSTNGHIQRCPQVTSYTISSTYIGNNTCIIADSLAINWAAEGTFITSLLLLSISLFSLQNFIQEYAYNLLDRQNHVQRLSKQNEDLKTQLKS
ncbi:hypothetical protein HDU76_005535, partial [Blyttiomyces sp. JEL0837]